MCVFLLRTYGNFRVLYRDIKRKTPEGSLHQYGHVRCVYTRFWLTFYMLKVGQRTGGQATSNLENWGSETQSPNVPSCKRVSSYFSCAASVSSKTSTLPILLICIKKHLACLINPKRRTALERTLHLWKLQCWQRFEFYTPSSSCHSPLSDWLILVL